MLVGDDSYYKILGVSENATQKDIKIAFRRLARKYHPDRNPSISDELMKSINISFENLSDPVKRRDYDRSLKISKSKERNKMDLSRDSDNSANYDTESTSEYIHEQTVNHNDSDEFFSVEKGSNFKSTPADKEGFPSFLESRYKIIVEPSLCLAFGSCEVLAPKVFMVEKNRQFNPKAIVISETAENFETIMDAAKTCPTKAIIIIDRYTGNCVYP
ncbi:DnaJ domain-containing protein [Candidatus Nitrosocosmicus franklandus]|uniref:Chaperone protein DnaJ n=1 Tax=Candidatus Nitrosocosmicus franklandianus TaxID=1798806 RepID=A0A484ICS0_9ARCH|nr:DnaJ domain-containing protein [Candidatus Nitrosocosmicus franklandus]VFJ14606.1 Chaperone protein DnaJ [Candidatus Nitrosocosmicus franklandus]